MDRAVAILRQMIRVGAASFVALCIDVSVFTSLLRHFELAAPAAFLGHVAGIVVHFAVSSLFFLRPEMGAVRGAARQLAALAKFFLAGGSGLLVTTIVIYLTVDTLGFHPLAGKAIAVCLSFLAVFCVLKITVLGERPAAVGATAPDETGTALLHSKA